MVQSDGKFTAIKYIVLKCVSPQTEICICVGAQQCANMCVNSVVCGEDGVSTLRVSVCIHAACVSLCACVLPGWVWHCQAIWSAVWGVHYPLSSAVGSGVHSICPFSLLFVPPSLFFTFLLIFCSTFLPIPLYFFCFGLHFDPPPPPTSGQFHMKSEIFISLANL